MSGSQSTSPPVVSRLSLVRELIAFLFITLGVIGTAALSVVLGNPWLWGAEALLVLGCLLGVRREPATDAPESDVEVTITRHDTEDT